MFVKKTTCTFFAASQDNRPRSFESGHVSDVTHVEVWASKAKTLTCPNCNQPAKLPNGGILGFPPNYLIQHRMVLATLNSSCVKLLCDVCTSDVAVRAMKVLENMLHLEL